jgi:hypothetical protein
LGNAAELELFPCFMPHTKATREVQTSFHFFFYYFPNLVTDVPLLPKAFQLSALQVGLQDYIHTSLKFFKEMLNQLPSPQRPNWL